MNKSELRQLYLEQRASLTVSAVSEMSLQISNRFFEKIDLKGINALHAFISIRKFNEVGTSVIYEKIWRDLPYIITAAPRSDVARGEIESVVFDRRTDWRENRWGIREPLGTELIDPQDIDIVIVPLLCFDKRGHRVGYGKGFYDRFLAKCRQNCLKVGLSFFPPLEMITDTSETDVPLDIFITPNEIYFPD